MKPSKQLTIPDWLVTALVWVGLGVCVGGVCVGYIMLVWNLFLSPVFQLSPLSWTEAFGCVLLLAAVVGGVWGMGQTK